MPRSGAQTLLRWKAGARRGSERRAASPSIGRVRRSAGRVIEHSTPLDPKRNRIASVPVHGRGARRSSRRSRLLHSADGAVDTRGRAVGFGASSLAISTRRGRRLSRSAIAAVRLAASAGVKLAVPDVRPPPGGVRQVLGNVGAVPHPSPAASAELDHCCSHRRGSEMQPRRCVCVPTTTPHAGKVGATVAV
jgi:hypothetical protein